MSRMGDANPPLTLLAKRNLVSIHRDVSTMGSQGILTVDPTWGLGRSGVIRCDVSAWAGRYRASQQTANRYRMSDRGRTI